MREEHTTLPDWQAIDFLAYPPEKAAMGVEKFKDKGDPAKRAAAAAAKKWLLHNRMVM